MNWIFDNIQLVIIVGSTIAWWLTQRKQGDEETPPPADRPGREKIDFEQLERNRQLREEIRRKREERRDRESGREVTAAGPEEGTEQIPPMLRELMGIPDPSPRPPKPAPPPLPPTNPVVSRQQRMEQEMAELNKKRRAADAMAAKVKVPVVSSRRYRRPSSDSLSDRDFLATLRDPRQARRAVVLREILGKPVALR